MRLPMRAFAGLFVPFGLAASYGARFIRPGIEPRKRSGIRDAPPKSAEASVRAYNRKSEWHFFLAFPWRKYPGSSSPVLAMRRQVDGRWQYRDATEKELEQRTLDHAW